MAWLLFLQMIRMWRHSPRTVMQKVARLFENITTFESFQSRLRIIKARKKIALILRRNSFKDLMTF